MVSHTLPPHGKRAPSDHLSHYSKIWELSDANDEKLAQLLLAKR
jgi:hypothetical protein